LFITGQGGRASLQAPSCWRANDWHGSSIRAGPAVLRDLRYSVRRLARTPGLFLALALTIALGIGSNAAVHGFVSGLFTRDSPVAHLDGLVSIVGADTDGPPGPISYDDYLSVREYQEAFEWVGAARESQATVAVDDRSWIVPVAAVTPELGALFRISPADGVVVSQRMRQTGLRTTDDESSETIRIDDAEARIVAVAPEWLDGLYVGRPVDIWMLWREASTAGVDRSSRDLWVIARLRPGISIDRAEAQINAGRHNRSLRVFHYTGITPEMAAGLSRIGMLLRAAAAAVFVIACVNVTCLLLWRVSARSHDTAVRVALGARRAQLARQLLADSVWISLAGAACGVLVATWTTKLVPLLFFDQDAAQLVFAPNFAGIVATSVVCVGITITCGLVPLFAMRDDRPATVLQQENTGLSPPMHRLRMGLIMAQMALCCLLIIVTAFLLRSFSVALQSNFDRRLGVPILATVQAPARLSRSETASHGLRLLRAFENAARSVAGITPLGWVAKLPGDLPTWQRFRVEPRDLPVREQTMDILPFTPATLADIALPPIAGRLFGGRDTPHACRVAIINEAAARDVFEGDAVGRSIDDPAGQNVEIVGVVATRQTERASNPLRPTIYYYADQISIPAAIAGPGRFRVPTVPRPSSAVLDSNVVSAGYFAAMGWPVLRGHLFADDLSDGCRVAVVTEEAADRYFGGNAVGAAVIDEAARRTQIIGVVRSTAARTLQRRLEPAIYFPMAQDFVLGMTLFLNSREANDTILADVHRRLDAVPGRAPAPVVVRTLDSHLNKTALAPLRIATTFVGTFAAMALAIGVLGLSGAMTDSARRQRRDIAVRIALGAPGWRVVRDVVSDTVRLAVAGMAVGILGSMLLSRWLAPLAPHGKAVGISEWVAGPLILMAAVAVATVVPASRALSGDARRSHGRTVEWGAKKGRVVGSIRRSRSSRCFRRALAAARRIGANG
jgi:predicted permease